MVCKENLFSVKFSESWDLKVVQESLLSNSNILLARSLGYAWQGISKSTRRARYNWLHTSLFDYERLI